MEIMRKCCKSPLDIIRIHHVLGPWHLFFLWIGSRYWYQWYIQVGKNSVENFGWNHKLKVEMHRFLRVFYISSKIIPFDLKTVIWPEIFYRIFSSLDMLLPSVCWTYSKKKKGCHGSRTWCIQWCLGVICSIFSWFLYIFYTKFVSQILPWYSKVMSVTPFFSPIQF